MSPGRLQKEIKKRHPFPTVAEEVVLSLLRTADRVQLQFSRLFRRFGLTSQQYNILRILRGHGAPLPILEIASRTITVVPGITGLIDRLEQAGWVRRQRSGTDRRVVLVEITPVALQLLAEVDEPLAQLHREVVRPLGSDEAAQLIASLDALREPWLSDAEPG